MATGYTIKAVTTAAPNTPAQLFTGRSARRTLVIAGAANNLTFVSTSGSDFDNNIFARLPASTTQIFPVRDLGPLVGSEIWVSSTAGALLINGAEIYDIPKASR